MAYGYAGMDGRVVPDGHTTRGRAVALSKRMAALHRLTGARESQLVEERVRELRRAEEKVSRVEEEAARTHGERLREVQHERDRAHDRAAGLRAVIDLAVDELRRIDGASTVETRQGHARNALDILVHDERGAVVVKERGVLRQQRDAERERAQAAGARVTALEERLDEAATLLGVCAVER